MPASLIVLPTQPEQTLSAHDLRLRDAVHKTRSAMEEIVREQQCGWPDIAEAFSDYNRAARRRIEFLERRAKKAETILRRVADLVPLDESLRRDVFEGLPRGHGRDRDTTLLNDNEARIIAEYRGMGTAERQTIRTLCSRLTGEATTNAGSEQRRRAMNLRDFKE